MPRDLYPHFFKAAVQVVPAFKLVATHLVDPGVPHVAALVSIHPSRDHMCYVLENCSWMPGDLYPHRFRRKHNYCPRYDQCMRENNYLPRCDQHLREEQLWPHAYHPYGTLEVGAAKASASGEGDMPLYAADQDGGNHDYFHSYNQCLSAWWRYAGTQLHKPSVDFLCGSRSTHGNFQRCDAIVHEHDLFSHCDQCLRKGRLAPYVYSTHSVSRGRGGETLRLQTAEGL